MDPSIRRRAMLVAAPLAVLGLALIIYFATRPSGRHRQGGAGSQAATDEAGGVSSGDFPTFTATFGTPTVPDDDIEPPDGATLRGNQAFIRWRGPLRAKGRVLWRREGSADFATARASDAQGQGDSLVARLADLSPGKYEYIVEHVSGGFPQRSRARHFILEAGPAVVFTPAITEATVKRDYNQRIGLTVKNETPAKASIAARAAVRFPDLPADIVGPGSVDHPVELAPGASLPLTLVVTAPDARRGSYDIPIEAAGVSGVARVRVDNPKLNLSIKVVSEDARTLAKVIELRNQGDAPLADLDVSLILPEDGDARLEPAFHHVLLDTIKPKRLVVYPTLYLEFRSLKAELECRAAGQSMRFPLQFDAPAGKRLIGIRRACVESNGSEAGYCTNNPNICTPVRAGEGNGFVGGPVAGWPLLVTVGINYFFGSSKGDCKCDKDNACETIKQMVALIDQHNDLKDPPVGWRVYVDWAAKFDELFRELSEKELACRVVEGSDAPPNTNAILDEITKLRHGLRTITDDAPFPAPDTVLIDRRPGAAKTKKEQDYRDILKIREKLLELSAALECPEEDDEGFTLNLRCPELGDAKTIKKRLDRAKKISDAGSKVVKNAKVKEAMEKLSKALGWASKNLGRLIKAQENCKLLKELLDAIDQVNNAKNSEELAKGFDNLFRVLGTIGDKIFPPPFDWYFKLLKENKSFFQDVTSDLIPDSRWKEIFERVDGYR